MPEPSENLRLLPEQSPVVGGFGSCHRAQLHEAGERAEERRFLATESAGIQSQAQFPLSPTFSVSTNLSAQYFAQRELQERSGALLAENGLDSCRLKLEITESQILENPISVARTLACLSDSGVKVQIDDFGTGYSSLGHLSSLRVHGLKMDQSFVAKLGADEKNAAIVRSIISLGENLKLDLIAEGVETAEQLDYLRQVDCPYAQGFLFARPMEPKAAAGFLREASVRGEVLLAAPSLSSR